MLNHSIIISIKTYYIEIEQNALYLLIINSVICFSHLFTVFCLPTDLRASQFEYGTILNWKRMHT